MSRKTFIVSTGWYDDYTIRGLFEDEDEARKYAAKFEDGEVDAIPLRGKAFVPARSARLRSTIDPYTGVVTTPSDEWTEELDARYDAPPTATDWYVQRRNSRGADYITVETVGDAADIESIRAVHADAVAKKRAEVLGL
ncbi:hypothetical protein ACFCZT_24735 [Streptomyces sp. NPDC056230]|uniref:hypothetical protein n=1 Tax=Streptomyces sp. NPDC056230 TaxID=3345754 RepID=UPI0035DC3800